MKRIIVTMLFLSIASLSANAQTGRTVLECGAHIGADKASGLVLMQENLASYGFLFFNYTSAKLTCPGSFELAARIEGRLPFRCVGLWDFDLEHIDTIVEVNFNPVGNDGWEASYLTNHSFGREPVSLPCSLTEPQ